MTLVDIANALKSKDKHMYIPDEDDFGPDDIVVDTYGTKVKGSTMVTISSTEEVPAYVAANNGIVFVAPRKK